MESLALLAAVIVTPAMFGGPIALLISLWNASKISRAREITIYAFASSSIIVGIFLIVNRISPGARNIGMLGVITGALAIWRLIKLKTIK